MQFILNIYKYNAYLLRPNSAVTMAQARWPDGTEMLSVDDRN